MSNANQIPREKLKELITRDGEALLQDPDRCEGLLKDHCGSQRREISALIGAMEERIPLELKSSWQTAMTPEAMRARLEQRLQDHRGLAPEVAAWAVDAWSYALSVPLGRNSDRLDSIVLTNAAAAGALGGAAVVRGAAGDRAPGGLYKAEAPADVNAARARELQAPRGAAVVAPAAWTTQKKTGAGVAAVLAAALLAYGLIPKKPPVDPCADSNTAPASCHPAPDPTPQPQPKHDKVVVAPPSAPLLAAGTPVAIRINQDLNSDDLNVGQELTGTVAASLMTNGNVIIPAGADAKLRVVSIDKAGKLSGKTQLQLELVQVSSGASHYNMAAYHTIEGPAQAAKAAEHTGIGAAVGAGAGAIVGHLFHHAGKGAGAGAVAGGATGAIATKPAPVKVQAEAVIQFKLARAIPKG
jgi:hypothetical protein